MRPLTEATERSVLAMFKGFMDEAGIQDSDLACTVAGFVGGELTCNAAEASWKEFVKPIGRFHAEDFFDRKDGKMTGRFAGISVEDADACVLRLVDMLASSGLEPIGMVLNANIFRTLTDDEKRYMTSAELYGKNWPQQPKHPYFACFHYCITNANQFTPNGEKIYLTFDRQDLYVDRARTTYNQLKGLGGKWGDRLAEEIVYTSKESTVLLQAADLLAYSISRLLNTGKRNVIVQSVLDKLAVGRDYIRAMDVHSIDAHLKTCPFRETFWKDMTDPDLIESIAAQGFKTLTYKTAEGYLTSHLRPGKVKELAKLQPQPVGGQNLNDLRDDST